MPDPRDSSSRVLAPIALYVHHDSDVAPSAQMERQLRHLIWSGQLPACKSLPSVRTLAAALDLNPMTVSKAFAKLASQGLVEHMRGQQMRVAAGVQRPSVAHRSEAISATLNDLVLQVRQLGLPAQAVIQRLQWMLDAPLDQVVTAAQNSTRSMTLASEMACRVVSDHAANSRR